MVENLWNPKTSFDDRFQEELREAITDFASHVGPIAHPWLSGALPQERGLTITAYAEGWEWDCNAKNIGTADLIDSFVDGIVSGADGMIYRDQDGYALDFEDRLKATEAAIARARARYAPELQALIQSTEAEG